MPVTDNTLISSVLPHLSPKSVECTDRRLPKIGKVCCTSFNKMALQIQSKRRVSQIMFVNI